MRFIIIFIILIIFITGCTSKDNQRTEFGIENDFANKCINELAKDKLNDEDMSKIQDKNYLQNELNNIIKENLKKCFENKVLTIKDNNVKYDYKNIEINSTILDSLYTQIYVLFPIKIYSDNRVVEINRFIALIEPIHALSITQIESNKIIIKKKYFDLIKNDYDFEINPINNTFLKNKEMSIKITCISNNCDEAPKINDKNVEIRDFELIIFPTLNIDLNKYDTNLKKDYKYKIDLIVDKKIYDSSYLLLGYNSN